MRDFEPLKHFGNTKHKTNGVSLHTARKICIYLLYLEDTSLRQTTSFEPSYGKIRCKLLTKQEVEEESKKNRESGTVQFNHMGSNYRNTNRPAIWQFSPSD